jgi:hypothetical protein
VFKSSVEVMPEGVRELGISDFDFLKFFEGYWGRVIESAFGFQHLNLNLLAFAIYLQPAVNLKAIAPQLELLESLKKLCGRKRAQYRMLKMFVKEDLDPDEHSSVPFSHQNGVQIEAW